MNELLVMFALVFSIFMFIISFVARLWGANRARKRYENKEIEWKKYENGFLKHNKSLMIVGVAFAIIGGLIGGYLLTSQPPLSIFGIWKILGIDIPTLVSLSFLFCCVFGFFLLGVGLAQYVHSVKKPLGKRQE